MNNEISYLHKVRKNWNGLKIKVPHSHKILSVDLLSIAQPDCVRNIDTVGFSINMYFYFQFIMRFLTSDEVNSI